MLAMKKARIRKISIHSPLRGETIDPEDVVPSVDISIHLLRAEQDAVRRFAMRQFGISIHLLRAEQDVGLLDISGIQRLISIHLLRAEQDPMWRWNPATWALAFQSTCSVRSKTDDHGHYVLSAAISTHLLRAEQDRPFASSAEAFIIFQPTCSVRSKTANGHKNCLQRSFILHRSPPHKSNKRDFQQKKEPSRRKNGISLVRTHPGFGVN